LEKRKIGKKFEKKKVRKERVAWEERERHTHEEREIGRKAWESYFVSLSLSLSLPPTPLSFLIYLSLSHQVTMFYQLAKVKERGGKFDKN